MEPVAKYLAFHASIILIIGLLCGAPYARAIKQQRPDHIVHSWRVAHASLPIGSMLMIALSAIVSQFAVAPIVKWVLATSLIVSGYAFCFALPLGAVLGHRGLSSRGPIGAQLVYLGNVTGAWFSIVAAIVFIYASYVSL